LKPDRKYQSILVQRLINKSMLNGKKLAAERMVYAALEEAAKKLKSEDPLEVFEKALKNVSPNFEVKSRRVGGANYQIPFPVSGHRQLHYAYSWMVQSARARKGMPYERRLAAEIVDAYNEAGAAFKKKEDTHKMAEANRAFAHFARG
jgi:small subunit ribosomal protein S7